MLQMVEARWAHVEGDVMNECPLLHIPIALYTFGSYFCDRKEPDRTATVEADSRFEAERLARKALNCDVLESMRYMMVESNPRYIEWRDAYRRFHGITA